METKRLFFFSLGATLLGVGAVGVVVPVLPTTPLVLASFFCFTKSSKRAERWISRNRYFGSYIENYQTKQGVPLDVKIKSVAFLWITLVISCYIFLKKKQRIKTFYQIICEWKQKFHNRFFSSN